MGCAAPPNSCWNPGGKFQHQGCISFMGPLLPCPQGPLLSWWWPQRGPPRQPLTITSPLLQGRGRLNSPNS